MSIANMIEGLNEVARDLWNAGKLNSQARMLERIAEALATQPAEQASAGSIGSLPTNDEVYAEVCRDRGKSNFYVSTNAVNDVMQAVRKLAAPLAPSDTQGAEGLPEYARVREEFQIVAGLGATADLDSAMMVVNALLRAALAQQAPDAVRDARDASECIVLGGKRMGKTYLANLERDAERWQAFVGSARIRILGAAGIREPEPNNYAHFGMEIWTIYGRNYGADLLKHMDEGNEYGRTVLTKYADIAIRLLKSTAPKLAEAGKGE